MYFLFLGYNMINVNKEKILSKTKTKVKTLYKTKTKTKANTKTKTNNKTKTKTKTKTKKCQAKYELIINNILYSSNKLRSNTKQACAVIKDISRINTI